MKTDAEQNVESLDAVLDELGGIGGGGHDGVTIAAAGVEDELHVDLAGKSDLDLEASVASTSLTGRCSTTRWRSGTRSASEGSEVSLGRKIDLPLD